MRIIKYENKYKEEWDKFVNISKNGTFLLNRDYMEYHSDRFQDHSYIFLDEKGKISALIPGTIKDEIFYSHRGLTYGGLILDKNSKMVDVLEYFELLNSELKKSGIKKVIYKSIPYIYHSYPSQEDEYALFKQKAEIFSLGIASTIELDKEFKFNKSRKSSISKAKRYGLEIKKDENFKEFWKLLEENLQNTHEAKPVHNINEILYLKKKFLEKIKLYVVFEKESLIAGVVVYEMKEVCHIQYISANERGKEISALDFLFEYLIKIEFKDKKYFDFGTSTEDNGNFLNKGLIFQKEGFGARGIVYKQYIYNIK
ncbi:MULTISPECIES: GNAT family N-acetyltransferase [Fusobacterium]|uniref:GNAT family N-acetyltransferase n=1 Tax=Fusobacterium TaxID=848 RepID=UPI0008A5DB86|nr:MULTISPECIES: GNAT family N-acetyltransferase [Fusobacterium]MCF2674753.1 GNAT family N-acetyltransferase [Fusobacterium varium]OFL82291.1 GNAT family acetyltransferase [Fusobacterium sp. HMSC073F01]